jgi:hypothetical protein
LSWLAHLCCRCAVTCITRLAVGLLIYSHKATPHSHTPKARCIKTHTFQILSQKSSRGTAQRSTVRITSFKSHESHAGVADQRFTLYWHHGTSSGATEDETIRAVLFEPCITFHLAQTPRACTHHSSVSIFQMNTVLNTTLNICSAARIQHRQQHDQ